MALSLGGGKLASEDTFHAFPRGLVSWAWMDEDHRYRVDLVGRF